MYLPYLFNFLRKRAAKTSPNLRDMASANWPKECNNIRTHGLLLSTHHVSSKNNSWGESILMEEGGLTATDTDGQNLA
jgi:hypothetical protein